MSTLKGVRLLVPVPRAQPAPPTRWTPARFVREATLILNAEEKRAILLGSAMGCLGSALLWPLILVGAGRPKLAIATGVISIALAFTAVLAALCEGDDDEK